jgi:hypothetical protein
MTASLRLLAMLAFAAAAPAFAYDDPGCQTVVWSAEHGHYHCVDAASAAPAVQYYPAAPVVAPRIVVGLSYGYPYYRGWYGPRFYARPAFVYAPRYYHGPYWGYYRHHW